MNKWAALILIIGILGAIVKYLDYRGDKKVHEHNVAQVKKMIDSSVEDNEKNLPVRTRFEGMYDNTQIIDIKKIDDFTLKQTIALDESYDYLSTEHSIVEMKEYFRFLVTSSMCDDSTIATHIQSGFIAVFDYQFNDGKRITSFQVDNQACKPYFEYAERSSTY